MFEGIKVFFAGLFDSGDISGTKKTNSYCRNLELCKKWQKEEDEQKKLERMQIKNMKKGK